MDAGDLAAMNEDFRLGLAIRKARSGRAEPARSDCMDCGEPIPENRRRAMPGCLLCVACQEAFEAGR